MPRRAQPSKHTVYFELLDACRQGGCPICTMALDAVRRYLDSVIYENVNDPETRDAVIAARGYCNDHSWALRDMNAVLGTALMYRDVVRHSAESLARRQSGAGGGLLDRLASLAGGGDADANGKGEARRHHCPACQARRRYETTYLGTLLAHLGDEQMVEALRGTGGLCLVHLDQAWGVTRDAAALERLARIQGEIMMALHAELSEFIRKQDYRYSSEAIGAEGTAWIRAVAMVAGKRGIR